jgi:hypothetical protein
MRSQPQSAQDIEEVLHRVLDEKGYSVDSHNESVVRQEIARSWQNVFGEVAIKDAIRLHADELNKKPIEGKKIKRHPRIPTEEETAQIISTILQEHPWMADSDRNGQMIVDWIDQNAGNRLTLENYRAAIQVLTNQLDRRPPQPVVPVAPAEPPEVLGKCSDGKPQLSLRTTNEWHLRNASIAQLKDFRDRARKSA